MPDLRPYSRWSRSGWPAARCPTCDRLTTTYVEPTGGPLRLAIHGRKTVCRASDQIAFVIGAHLYHDRGTALSAPAEQLRDVPAAAASPPIASPRT